MTLPHIATELTYQSPFGEQCSGYFEKEVELTLTDSLVR
jgi:hypothetical protein